jgi:hypothetical protein
MVGINELIYEYEQTEARFQTYRTHADCCGTGGVYGFCGQLQ